MLLRILGSGTISTPHLKNGSGYLINDELLLDCGPGIWRSLAINKVKNDQIKYIVISHFHIDHVSDIAPFLMQRYLMNVTNIEPVTLIGPIGLNKWFNDLSEISGDWMKKLPIKLIEISDMFKLKNYKINALNTYHTDTSLCYRVVDLNNKSLFYSGDSDEHNNLSVLSENVDLAIIEASNLADTKIDGHLTPQIAAKIAESSSVKKLVLTHFYKEVYNSGALSKAKKIYNGQLIIAEDNMTIEI